VKQGQDFEASDYVDDLEDDEAYTATWGDQGNVAVCNACGWTSVLCPTAAEAERAAGAHEHFPLDDPPRGVLCAICAVEADELRMDSLGRWVCRNEVSCAEGAPDDEMTWSPDDLEDDD
jgi:hypothetical protein